MENKKMSLADLKAKVDSSNFVANIEAIKGGELADCHQLLPKGTVIITTPTTPTTCHPH
ncbi:hypothetical protein [Chryseotalea sanaruensis]|nr:hypothetical protein [Chryseotalea sanaruensis]